MVYFGYVLKVIKILEEMKNQYEKLVVIHDKIVIRVDEEKCHWFVNVLKLSISKEICRKEIYALE
jgi:hypothetical protein